MSEGSRQPLAVKGRAWKEVPGFLEPVACGRRVPCCLGGSVSSGGVCPWVGVEGGGLVFCLLKGLTSKCITDRQQGPGAGVCPLTVEAELCLAPDCGGPGV